MFRALRSVVLAACLAGCVNIVPNPTTSLQPSQPPISTPSASPSPTAPATPSPTAAVASPTPADSVGPGETPSATIDPELAAQIDEVIEQMPDIRQLEPLAEVPYEFVTREQFQEDLTELAFEDIPREVYETQERLLKRLGLVDDDADLVELILELYGGAVAAFYRPDTGRFYIIERDAPFGPADGMIVAHEYTHALQDQHFDLEDDRIIDPAEGDAALGQLAAIEGDATLAMQQWAIENLSFEELIELFQESVSQYDDQTLADMPPILQRQLQFPYVEGFIFVNELYQLGSWDAVNQLLEVPPPSTEQILHPEKYLADEAPEQILWPDSNWVPTGFELAHQETLGELNIGVLVAGDEEPVVTIPGLPLEWPFADVAAGWAGDRVQMYEDASGGWAIVWVTEWDSAADADEFSVRTEQLLSTLDGPGEVEEREGNVVVLFGASDQAILDDFNAALLP